MKLALLKAVYSYYFPEVRRLMTQAEARFTPELYKLSTPVESLERLSTLFDPPLSLTSTDGAIDLDRLHEPLLSRVSQLYSAVLPGLKEYAFRYPTAGSSEGLFHLLSQLKSEGVASIYVCRGEYEGFSAYASHHGMQTIEVDIDRVHIPALVPGVWFISAPSARDGSIFRTDTVSQLCNAGHRIVLDLAYLGLTEPFTFDISHENILAIVFSLSKPFGLFRFRVGYLFSRREIPSLYANRWFKDISRHIQGLHVIESLGLTTLYERYRGTQCSIVEALRARFQINWEISDALLITTLSRSACPPRYRDQFKPYLRGERYRFCLTPYFEQVEHGRLPREKGEKAADRAGEKPLLAA